jgi:hypothetical protein
MTESRAGVDMRDKMNAVVRLFRTNRLRTCVDSYASALWPDYTPDTKKPRRRPTLWTYVYTRQTRVAKGRLLPLPGMGTMRRRSVGSLTIRRSPRQEV